MGRVVVIIAGLVSALMIVLALRLLAPGDEALPLSMQAPLSGDAPGGGTPARLMVLEGVFPGDPFEAPVPIGRRELTGGGVRPPPAPDDGPLEPPPEAEIAALIADLRDDDIRWNAGSAMRKLSRYLQRSPAREVVAEALAGELDSLDMQQRYFAALTLMRADLEQPPERLLAVAIDMMADGVVEGAPWAMKQIRRNTSAPQSTSLRFLIDHVRGAEPAEQGLLNLLGLPRQQEARFLSAFVLAYTGHAEHTDRLAPVLIDHLADNNWKGDAVMAMNALMQLDQERVIWWLQVSSKPDDQFTRSKRLLLHALRNNGEITPEVAKRDNVVTNRVHNPVKGWRFGSYQGAGD